MLILRNIVFTYNDQKAGFKLAIDGANFKENIITCILGENGCGKSTLLNLIGGHLLLQQGSIHLFNKDITCLKAHERPTATVFQQIGLFPHLSVKRNVELAFNPNSFFRKEDLETKQKTASILRDFQLLEFSNRKPDELSIGQQQRVAIARAIAVSPKVLLLDEPTSALDYANINALKVLLNHIKSKHTVPIVIIVSHDLPFVMSVADEIKLIENGRLSFEGSIEVFRKSELYIH